MQELVTTFNNWWNNEMTHTLFDLKPFQVRRIAGVCQLISGCIVLIDIFGVNWFSRRGHNLISLAQFIRQNAKRILISLIIVTMTFYYYIALTTRKIDNLFDYDQPTVDKFMMSNFFLLFVFPIMLVAFNLIFHRKHTYWALINILRLIGEFLTHHKFKEITVVICFIIFLLSSIVAIIYA